VSRYVYTLLLVVNSAVLSFLIAAVLGTIVFSGEVAQGVGVHWALSLPAIVVAATVIGILTFPWYRAKESIGAQLSAHLVSATAATTVGFATAVLALEVYTTIAAQYSE